MNNSSPRRTRVTPVIAQYWHSKQRPKPIEDAFASFREHNPDLHHLAFDESKADAFLAEHFSRRELGAFRACAVPAMQADYFRYCAIFTLGGVYADADLQCIRELRPLLERPCDGILFGRQGPLTAAQAARYSWPHEVGPYLAVGNGFFVFPEAHHPLLATAIEIATTNIERRVADGARGVWLTAGPGIFTSMYLLQHLGSIDAFIRYTAGSVLEPSATVFCEIVEGTAVIDGLLGGVAIRPRDESRAWIRPVKVARKAGTAAHWWTYGGSIFR